MVEDDCNVVKNSVKHSEKEASRHPVSFLPGQKHAAYLVHSEAPQACSQRIKAGRLL